MRVIGAPLMHSGWRTLRAEAFSDYRPSYVNELPISHSAHIDKCQREALFHPRSPVFHLV
jgi:hypothetical protein